MKKQALLILCAIFFIGHHHLSAKNKPNYTPVDVASTTETTGDNTCALTFPFPGFPIDFKNTGADWIDYDLGSDFLLTANADGTMTISGLITNAQAVDFGSGSESDPCGIDDEWQVDLVISVKKTYTEWQGMGGDAHMHDNCAGLEGGLEYWDISGILTGLGCNIGRTVNLLGPQPPYQLQIGTGAMYTDGACGFTMATWFDAEENGQAIKADIYAAVDETCYNNLTFPPPIPAISITDNDCASSTAGMFNVDTDCSETSHIEWTTDNGVNWSTSAPVYDTNTAQTVMARCVDDTDATCISANSNQVNSNPTNCTPSCGDTEASFGCAAGPNNCNVVVNSYLVNIPRDVNNGNRPVTPFNYTIPDDPTNGQFQVIARYRTRTGAGAEANSVSFNGTAGTPFNLVYGSDNMYATNFETVFTSGDIAALTLTIDSDPVDADNLPGLEILVFKCDGTSNSTFAYTSPNRFIWVGAPDEQSNPYCITRTLCLPENACEAGGRDLAITNGIFNIHQDHPDCDRQFVMEYNTDDGASFNFTETPPDNNSTFTHTIGVSAATTAVDISLCTWNSTTNPDPDWTVDCGRGVSTGWANVVVEDLCACETCTSPTISASAFAASCTNGVPNNDGYLQLSTATNATHYNYIMASDYSTGDADMANATAFDPSTDLPLQFGTLANPTGSQDYTIRVFNGANSCFTDIVVTLTEQSCQGVYDVEFTKTVDQNLPNINDTITFTLIVTNHEDAVTGTIVTDVLPTGLVYTNNHDASTGTFDGTTWTIGNMAVGASDTLDIDVKVIVEGVHNNSASVAITETETDLTNNEDDACVSVPIEICDDGSQSVDVTGFDVNGDGSTMYRWYVSADNGATYDSIPANNGGIAQTYNITQAAYYTYVVNDGDLGNCGEQLCCPIIVETTTCVVCPPKNCIPIQIEQIN